MKKKDETLPEIDERNKEEVLRIPLRLIPNESESLAEDMQEIFDEDKIVHRHGSAEPERD